MKPYSRDLGLGVLAAVDRGAPRREVSETGGVSKPPSGATWGSGARLGVSISNRCPAPGPQGRCAGDDSAGPGLSRPWPHAPRAPRALRGQARRRGLRLQREPRLRAPGVAARRKFLPAPKRDEEGRALWREGVGETDPRLFVFVHECGTHTSITRLRTRPREARGSTLGCPATVAGTRSCWRAWGQTGRGGMGGPTPKRGAGP